MNKDDSTYSKNEYFNNIFSTWGGDIYEESYHSYEENGSTKSYDDWHPLCTAY